MNKVKLTCVLAAMCLSGSTLMHSQPIGPANRPAKQVIIMIPDGMGLTNVTATRTRLNGPAGAPLNLETLDRVGYMRTHSETNTVTDSSAAASAFASHLAARKCENEIARQYVMETQPDVLLGGGRATFKTATLTSGCPSPGDFIAAALGQGYTYATTSDEMWKAASGSTGKILGLFADTYLTPEYQRKKGGAQPGLPDMTAVALAILERKQAGFFLMVEGSLIDSANHAENPDYQFGEMLAFDESVKVVLNWINASPERKEETLLIVVPDHETGGFAMLGSETPGAGLGPFTSGWTFTLYPNDPKDFEAHHTAGDLVLWSQGPGSNELARPIDNTWVYGAVKRAMRQ